MKMIAYILLLLPLLSFSQIYNDSKIIVTLPDSSNVYAKVKESLVRNGFQVKDLLTRDTLFTYPRVYKGMNVALRALITDNKVTITGYYSLKKMYDFGYAGESGNRKRIIYYPGALTWNLMLKVSREISSSLAFAE